MGSISREDEEKRSQQWEETTIVKSLNEEGAFDVIQLKVLQTVKDFKLTDLDSNETVIKLNEANNDYSK